MSNKNKIILDEALFNYYKRIAGQKIVFNAMLKEKREEFAIPEDLTHTYR
jgi:hypothetical protein